MYIFSWYIFCICSYLAIYMGFMRRGNKGVEPQGVDLKKFDISLKWEYIPMRIKQLSKTLVSPVTIANQKQRYRAIPQ